MAGRRFAVELEEAGLLATTARVAVELYGSLALTGHGHGTDRAILLGLLGEQPDRIDPAAIDGVVRRIREEHALSLLGQHVVRFEEADDLVWHRRWTRGNSAHEWSCWSHSGGGALLSQLCSGRG